MEDVLFPCGGETLAGWWFPAVHPSTEQHPAPCVVLCHGFGGTKDSGLRPYAERFSGAGLHVLAFDYRGFGRSSGSPRQLLEPRDQLDDIAAAVAYVRSRADVDPDRVALWGTSYGGGHVIEAAVRDGDVAAVVSQCPAVDGAAVALRAVRLNGLVPSARGLLAALADQVAAWRRDGEPRRIPIMGLPGSVAAMTAPDVVGGFSRIAGPTFTNTVCARVQLRVPFYRPGRLADRMPCPWLVQVCSQDSVAPPHSAVRAARSAGERATLTEYAIGHFDIYVDDSFEVAVAEQTAFLTRALSS